MIKPKKKFFLSLLLVLSVAIFLLPRTFVLGGVSAVKEYRSHPNAMPYSLYFSVENMKDLEDASQYIIKGYVDYDFIAPVRRDISSTTSALQITEVYKGNLKSGDKVSLREPFYITLDENRHVLTYLGYYPPCEEDMEYIFFLNFDGGSYEPTALELSRHGSSLQIFSERHEKIHNEISQKYFK